ncbi:hypothetical protein GWO13_08260 [Candidatus Bathyarchaeota archaeon]|nr:hypothetical protein [Candidatus Bathyarchaeota archaeon]
MQYDNFSIYGFQVEYPENWRVELYPKSAKETGEVSFISPEKDRMFVFWGLLEEVKKTFTSLDEHVERTIKKIEKTRGVDSLEVVERKELEINGHRAIFTNLQATISRGFFLFRRKELRGLLACHLYCEKASRFFILHGSLSSMEHEDVFDHMQKSFKCHR